MAARYFWTEAVLAAAFAVVTVALLPRRQLGLRAPRFDRVRYVIPLSVLFAVGLACWVAARLQLPEGAAVDDSPSLGTLRSTLLVGVTEEWTYRGLLLSFFTRRWGLRRGAFAALSAFSALHLLNVFAGSPPAVVAIQLVMSFVTGSVLLLGALGMRSILLCMLAHGLHDFFVIDLAQLVAAGAPPLAAGILATSLITGLWSLHVLRRLPPDGGEAYPDDASSGAD